MWENEERDIAERNEKDNVSRVAIGSDHGGFEAKEFVKR